MSLRVVVFGTGGPLSLSALAAVASRGQLVGLVTPGGAGRRGAHSIIRRLMRWRAAGPLRAAARRVGARILDGGRPSLSAELRRLRPDLLCIAAFPRLLPPALLESARLGAVGLHPSLLPRHRGPDALFWTYFLDDREAGVTLYWLDAGVDTGDILYQDAVPLARGRPVHELYADLAARGASLLERALEAIPEGSAPHHQQDAAQATREAAPNLQSCRIDWERWPAERVFHVLAGLGGSYPLLADAGGRRVRFGGARSLRSDAHTRPPGTLERCAGGLRVFCVDGIVEVSAPPLVPRVLRPLLGAASPSRALAR